MTTNQVAPLLLISFVTWRIALRIRRNVGRQSYQPGKLALRAAVLGAALTLVSFFAAFRPMVLAAEVAGLAAGAGLAYWGIKLTRFERDGTGDFYTPNTYLGTAVTLLFAARILYRFATIYSDPAALAGESPAASGLFSNPLTLGLLGVTAGFYLFYTLGVLQRFRRSAPAIN
jgi:hypothetical protein